MVVRFDNAEPNIRIAEIDVEDLCALCAADGSTWSDHCSTPLVNSCLGVDCSLTTSGHVTGVGGSQPPRGGPAVAPDAPARTVATSENATKAARRAVSRAATELPSLVLTFYDTGILKDHSAIDHVTGDLSAVSD